MKNNITAANCDHGLEYWSLVPFPNERMIVAHNGQRQAWNAFPERTAEMYLVDVSMICADGLTLGLVSGQGYTHGVEMLRGEIRGCDVWRRPRHRQDLRPVHGDGLPERQEHLVHPARRVAAKSFG